MRVHKGIVDVPHCIASHGSAEETCSVVHCHSMVGRMNCDFCVYGRYYSLLSAWHHSIREFDLAADLDMHPCTLTLNETYITVTPTVPLCTSNKDQHETETSCTNEQTLRNSETMHIAHTIHVPPAPALHVCNKICSTSISARRPTDILDEFWCLRVAADLYIEERICKIKRVQEK